MIELDVVGVKILTEWSVSEPGSELIDEFGLPTLTSPWLERFQLAFDRHLPPVAAKSIFSNAQRSLVLGHAYTGASLRPQDVTLHQHTHHQGTRMRPTYSTPACTCITGRMLCENYSHTRH